MTEPGLVASHAPVPVIWGDVPPRNKNFTGREAILTRLRDLARMRENLSEQQVTAVLPEDPLPQALQGLGGVGKTAVAIEYAYRFRADYDVVWWIPADQLPSVRSALAALAGRLGLETAMTAGIEAAARTVLDALRLGNPYNRWLLIFDNADQPEDIRQYFPGGPGDVLITSRNHRWQGTVATVPVDVFTRAESKEFLSKRAPIKAADPDTDMLADKLGDLPLALDQAGAMLAETGMPVREYIGLLDDQFVKIMAEGKSADYPESVTAAWSISVTKVREQLPLALELLRCCAFFGPDPIPRDVFRRGSLTTGTRVSELMADPILLARAIRELGRFALVGIGGRAITVHRLVQALLRGELDEDEQARYRREVHLILAAAAPPDPADDRQWPRYAEVLPHVTSETTDMARSPDPAVRRFALDMMRYLYLSGDFTSCQTLTRRFTEQWTEDSGPDDPSVLDAVRIYADVLMLIGEYGESYTVIEETVRRAERVLGERDRITLSMRSALAANERARGNFMSALNLDAETLTLNEDALGPANAQTVRAISNLGLNHGLNGDYRRARELSQRAYLLASEAEAGISATEVLICWYNLAWAVRLQGLYTEARDVGEDAWDYGKERLGPDHFATLRAANGLSITLRRMAPLREEALQIAREVLDQCQKRFGDLNPDTMAVAINLVNIQRVNGLTDEALALAESTIARYPEVYGADHPYNYGCSGNLALLQRVAGKATEARRLNEFALAGLDSRLTRDHYYSLVVAVNLASDLAELGKIDEARALGENSLERLIKLLGRDHPLTLGCAANLVVDLRADHAEAEAEKLAADTMSRYETTLGLTHPDAMVAAQGRRLDFDFDPPPL
ncbi:MAG: tetratricopeptide repeat protein [Streptosporangiaceae bacterium]|nr:tetratricopeptide repeat protein [Streptosporangiaceae bacterium]